MSFLIKNFIVIAFETSLYIEKSSKYNKTNK